MRAAAALALTFLTALSLAAAPAGARILATFDAPLDPSPLLGFTGRAPEHVLAGPVLAGDRVVWAQGAPRSVVLIESVPASGGGPVRTLATLPPLPGGDRHLLRVLVASPTRIAWFEGQEHFLGLTGPSEDLEGLQGRIVAGPLDGPFRTVGGCDRIGPGTCAEPPCLGTGGSAGGATPRMALAGDVLLYTDWCGADGTFDDAGADRAVHRVDLAADPPAPSSPLTADAPDSSFTALGPGLAAQTTAGGPVVHRVADGAEQGPYPPMPVSYVQADGKVAGTLTRVVGRYRVQEAVAWAAPGDPVVHHLPFAEAWPATLEGIADDLLLLQPTGQNTGLALAALDGTQADVVRIVPTSGPERLPAVVMGVGLDGSHVTWAVTTCEHTAIGISAAGDAPQVFAPRVCDSARTGAGRVRADRRGRAGLPVICGRPCAGTLAVRFPGVNVTLQQRFRLPGAPRFQRVAFQLTPRVRRAIGRGSRPARSWIAGTDRRPSELVVSAARGAW